MKIKNTFVWILFLFSTTTLIAQSEADKKGVKQACMNYIDGFYTGDQSKLKESLSPTLFKYGYWKNNETGVYGGSQMTYEKALDYAKGVLEKKNFPKEDAPKKVELLDIMEHIAAVKVTAWWGVDYILLSKQSGKWMIEEVLWQGPLRN